MSASSPAAPSSSPPRQNLHVRCSGSSGSVPRAGGTVAHSCASAPPSAHSCETSAPPSAPPPSVAIVPRPSSSGLALSTLNRRKNSICDRAGSGRDSTSASGADDAGETDATSPTSGGGTSVRGTSTARAPSPPSRAAMAAATCRRCASRDVAARRIRSTSDSLLRTTRVPPCVPSTPSRASFDPSREGNIPATNLPRGSSPTTFSAAVQRGLGRLFPFSFSYSSSGARFPSLLRRHQGRRSVSPRPRLFAFCVPFSASSGGRGRVDLVSRGRVGRGASRRGSDGLASFVFLGRAIDDGRGAPRACVRLCRCLSTTPEARKAMPLKGVGGTHSPSNTSSPSNALLARTCARSTRSLFDMTRSDKRSSRLRRVALPPLRRACLSARRRRSRSNPRGSRRAKCEPPPRGETQFASRGARPKLSSSARKYGGL